jgi:hypothetical protein
LTVVAPTNETINPKDNNKHQHAYAEKFDLSIRF